MRIVTTPLFLNKCRSDSHNNNTFNFQRIRFKATISNEQSKPYYIQEEEHVSIFSTWIGPASIESATPSVLLHWIRTATARRGRKMRIWKVSAKKYYILSLKMPTVRAYVLMRRVVSWCFVVPVVLTSEWTYINSILASFVMERERRCLLWKDSKRNMIVSSLVIDEEWRYSCR